MIRSIEESKEPFNPLCLFCGKSASGKTTIANLLEQFGFKQVYSYTTRPPRYDGETGHIFLSETEFDNLGELAAYTEYNGHHYGTTFKQLEEYNIYTIDVPGVEELLKNINKINRPIIIIYFDAAVCTRIHRMIDRGDSDMAIVSRLLQDEKDDWEKQLSQLAWHYRNNEGMNVALFTVDANKGQKEVLNKVLDYIAIR